MPRTRIKPLPAPPPARAARLGIDDRTPEVKARDAWMLSDEGMNAVAAMLCCDAYPNAAHIARGIFMAGLFAGARLERARKP